MATNCTASQAGCTQITCQPGPDPGKLYIASNPTGSGGIALNCNFQTIEYRQPKCTYSGNALDPTGVNDFTQDFCIGSRWLNTAPGGPSRAPIDKMSICVDNSQGAAGRAVWTPWLHWWDTTQWPTGQNAVLMVDTHFAADGEIRRILNSNLTVGAQLVLTPQHTDMQDGAIVLGIHGQAPGGDARGKSAVDFQNSRAAATQVASGGNAFIAGGANNTSAGDYSHSEGYYSQTGSTSEGAHCEGYADSDATKQAGANGAHAEGSASSGTITAGTSTSGVGEGAHAEGSAENSGTIQATANGAHAEGSGNGGTISSSGEGAHAEGSAEAGGLLQSHANGAHAEGSANGGTLTAGTTTTGVGEGAHAEGSAECAKGRLPIEA